MTDQRLARKWVEQTKADEVITDKVLLKKISLGLLRAWRRYKKTGQCPWTGEELYDFTYFLHAFAHRYAGEDDELYNWLSNAGLKMLDTMEYPEPVANNRRCRICGGVIAATYAETAAKGGAHQIKAWCEKCESNARQKKLLAGLS